MLRKSETMLEEAIKKSRIIEKGLHKDIHYMEGIWLLKTSMYHPKQKRWFFGVGEGHIQMEFRTTYAGLILLCECTWEPGEPFRTICVPSDELLRAACTADRYPEHAVHRECKVNVQQTGSGCYVAFQPDEPIRAGWVEWDKTAGELDDHIALPPQH